MHGGILELQTARQYEKEDGHQKDQNMVDAIQQAVDLQPGSGFRVTLRHFKRFNNTI